MKYLVFLLWSISKVATGNIPIVEFTPDTITVAKESRTLKNAAKILFTANAPDGTNALQVQGEALEDLTGNVWEDGYRFPYNTAVPYIYYPNTIENAAMVYKMRFGNINKDGTVAWWTKWSKVPEYTKSKASNLVLIKLTRSWEEAKEWCYDHNMILASIHGKEEAAAAVDLMTSLEEGQSVEEAWIGMYDANYDTSTTDRKWTWVGGGAVGDSNIGFEDNGDNLHLKSDSGCVGCYDHVKFTIRGNFEVGWIENDDLDKDEFLCKKMKMTHVKHRDLNDGGKKSLV